MTPARRLSPAAAVAAAALALVAPASAQDSLSFDEDELFGSDEVVEAVAESAEGSAMQDLLSSDAVRIGGSVSGKATPSWTWYDPWADGLDPSSPDDYGLEPELSALVFFDGRPSQSTRFYGSVKTAWPFEDPDNTKVFELFSDFSWNDSLYFRFGKQTINWGVGYFFSPANVMNLEAIDVLDPTAQLEGPVALRVNHPIPGTQHNLWAYAVFDSADMKPEDTALAAKAEFVYGGWELGVGGYYKKDDPIRGVLTAVGSIGQVGVFGEATLSRGSSRTWVNRIEPSGTAPFYTIVLNTDDASPFFKGTAGLSYSNSETGISVMAQYLYDGEGYSDADREALIDEAIVVRDTLGDTAAFSTAYKLLILNSGRHYAAASFTKSDFLADDLSFSLFAMGNLSDLSAYLKPGLSYEFFDGMSMSLSALFAVGFDSGEYVVLNDGRAIGVSIALTLGSGAF